MMTDKQLAVFLQKYLDKLNEVSAFVDFELNRVSLADITSPGTVKGFIMGKIGEVTDCLSDDIAVLSKK